MQGKISMKRLFETPFGFLYLRLALWWLDFNLLSGPDVYKKIATKTEYYVISFQ